MLVKQATKNNFESFVEILYKSAKQNKFSKGVQIHKCSCKAHVLHTKCPSLDFTPVNMSREMKLANITLTVWLDIEQTISNSLMAWKDKLTYPISDTSGNHGVGNSWHHPGIDLVTLLLLMGGNQEQELSQGRDSSLLQTAIFGIVSYHLR